MICRRVHTRALSKETGLGGYGGGDVPDHCNRVIIILHCFVVVCSGTLSARVLAGAARKTMALVPYKPARLRCENQTRNADDISGAYTSLRQKHSRMISPYCVGDV